MVARSYYRDVFVVCVAERVAPTQIKLFGRFGYLSEWSGNCFAGEPFYGYWVHNLGAGIIA